jgi:hypothetical protein
VSSDITSLYSGVEERVDARWCTTETRVKIENALHWFNCPDINVIKNWRYCGCTVFEPDMNDPASIALHGQSACDPPHDCRKWMDDIGVLNEADRERLQRQ